MAHAPGKSNSARNLQASVIAVESNDSSGRPHLDGAAMEEQIRYILKAIGEDPDREGLLKTPRRVAQALTYLTRGYAMDPEQVINDALFTEEYEEMIVQKDIDFFSLCEHHMLPFFGKAHVAYIPHHKIVGISKLARLVDVYARRLQVQERMTNQIANTIMDKLDALGVAVVLEAEHLCMRMRGVEKQNSYVITSSLLGAFRTRQETRNEFMTLIRQK
jgi:GTP cyclohydrolase I